MRRPPKRLPHTRDCQCVLCANQRADGQDARRLKAIHAWEAESIKKYGFYIHYVIGDPGSGLLANTHTHGLPEKFQHPDIQIVVNIDQSTCLSILHCCVNLIKEGVTFKPGVDYEKIITLPVRFIKATECGRKVLRIILPDPDGRLLEGSIQPPFDIQYKHLVSS